MVTAATTETGRRANNEDAVFASPRLVAVADGVGGAVAGEVASRLVITAIAGLDKRRLNRELTAELGAAITNADAMLGFLITCRPELAGMGSTLTAVALANDGRYLVANVGDSRTYLWREHNLRQLTRDQSLVQTLVDRGAITPEEARHHPHRSVVLQALDGAQRVMPTIESVSAQAGDRLLLCSDGVSDVLADADIAAALAIASRDAAARQLVRRALDAGGRDNISAVVADVVATDDPSAGWLAALPAPGHAR